MVNPNTIISKNNETVYYALKDKFNEYGAREKAQLWEPTAMLVEKFSAGLFIYVESLKKNLKIEAGFNRKKDNNSYEEDDRSAVDAVFNVKGKGNELQEKLRTFKNDILSINIEIDSTFRNALILTTSSFDNIDDEQQDNTKTFFNHVTVVAALAFLGKLQNNVKVIENQMILFCLAKCTSDIRNCNFASGLTGQNIKYARAGDRREISAGIGYFRWWESKPQITINGLVIKTDLTGIANYKLSH